MLAHRHRSGKGVVHESFDNIDVMAARCKELDAVGVDVWYAVGSYTHRHDEIKKDSGKKYGRRKDNVNSFATFFLDIDVDPDKPGKSYSSVEDAEGAIAAFAHLFGEPHQCQVQSGGGLHVYWMLDEDIPGARWEEIAIKFKDAVKVAGLLADPSRTSDTTSLLRPVGTTNRKAKYGTAGRRVDGRWCRCNRVSPDEFEAACERVRGSEGTIVGRRPSSTPITTATTLSVTSPRPWFSDLPTDAKIATLQSMLNALPVVYVSDRMKWVAVGAALAGVHGLPRNICFDLWSKWSQSTEEGARSWAESTDEEHRLRMDGFNRSGVGALINLAKAAGWLPEMLRNNLEGQSAFPAVAAALDASGERWTIEQARTYTSQHLIFVRADNQYFLDGLPLSREALDTSLARFMPVTFERSITASGLLKKGYGRVVDHVGYKPGALDTFIDHDGRKIANTWKPHVFEQTFPTREETSTFVDLVKHLGAGNPETQAGIKRFFTKIAYLCLNPSARITHVTLLIGRHEGCGKSTLTEAIPRALFGSANVRTVETSELSSDFNGYAQGARVLVLPELWLGRRKDAEDQANRLKPLITEDRIAVVKKGKDGRTVDNYTTIFASSNHEDAALFGTYDRRYDVIATDSHRMSLELSTRVYALIDRPGALLHLCLAYAKDASTFNPNAAPPQTTAKLAMIEANRGDWAQQMRDAFDAREWPFCGDVVAVSDVIVWLGDEFRPAPSDKAVRGELLSMADGAFNALAQRRHGARTQQKRVIVLRNITSWKKAGATVLYKHYEDNVIRKGGL